jgi:threonine dehydratase
MWTLASQLLDGAIVVTLREVVNAIKLLAERNCVIAEGAGAASTAAALRGEAGHGKVVCVLSGGNISATRLSKVLQGMIP